LKAIDLTVRELEREISCLVPGKNNSTLRVLRGLTLNSNPQTL